MGMQVLLLNGRKKKDIIDNNSLSLSSDGSRKGEGFHFSISLEPNPCEVSQ